MNGRDLFYKLRHRRLSARHLASALVRRVNYALGLGGNALPPLRIFINLNNLCNARCAQCDVGARDAESLFYRTMIQDGRHELPVERLEELFSEAGVHRPLIAFNGVEPTLYKDLPRAIRSAKEAGCQTQVTTNGILLPKLAQDLAEAGLDILWVSLDGPPATHDEIRGVPGGFDKAMEGLQLLRQRRNEGKGGPSLNVVMTVFHQNQHGVFALMELLEQIGLALDEVMVQHLQFISPEQAAFHNHAWPAAPVTPISAAQSAPDRIDLSALADEIRRVGEARFSLNIRWKPNLRTEADLRTYYREPLRFWGDGRCRVFWSELQVLADGGVTGSQRCFPLPQLGNLMERPFREIWNSTAMKEWRLLLRKEGALPACSRCCSIL